VHLRLPTFAEQLLERWVLLHDAEAIAVAVTDERRAMSATLYTAARVRTDGALGDHGTTALVLARDAIPLLLAAGLTARGPEVPPHGASVAELWERYDDLARRGRVPEVPPSLTAARGHSLSQELPDREIDEDGDVRVDEAIALATFLEGVVELRTPRAIRLQRRLRQLALIVASAWLLAEIIIHRPRMNRARHTSVVSSSRRPGAGPPTDLTNGTVEPALAFATKDEPDAWVNIDLVRTAPASEVKLWNSNDHTDDSLPIRVETSVDGVTWEAGGLQSTHFTPSDPAVVGFPKRMTRFVRIHAKPGGALYLNEVEVR
jgi:hypothetical protein